MDYSLVQRSVQYHGDELLSALQLEQGETFLEEASLSKFPTSTVLGKTSSLADDRKKTLLSFIAKKADMLFKKHTVEVVPLVKEIDNKDFYAILPPLECFMNTSEDARRDYFYQSLAKGDVIVGSVFGKHTHGLIITLVCVSAGKTRDIHDLCIKCFCNTNQIPLVSNHEEPLEAFEVGEFIQGVVLEVLPDTRKIYISMKDSMLPADSQGCFKLGILTDDDFPPHHKETVKYCGESYSRSIEKTLGFMNPSTVSHLSTMMGFRLQDSPSLMRGLHAKRYPKEDYASEIFKLQCGKWAYKSVEQGIQYFKSGNNVGAFQCLNKALQIDPRNVEALVARGALFANNNSFSRALEDFYKALDNNPNHVNAGKYTVETLVAYGKQHEEHSRTEEAIKCFQKALLLNPSHVEALHSMRSSQRKVEELEKERTRLLEIEVEKKSVMDDAGDDPPATSNTSVTKERLKRLLNVEKDTKNDSKQKIWPSSSSSTSSLTSDSETSTLSLDNRNKEKNPDILKQGKTKRSRYDLSDEDSNSRRRSSVRRSGNSGSRKKRLRSSSISSSSSSERGRLSSRSKRRRSEKSRGEVFRSTKSDSKRRNQPPLSDSESYLNGSRNGQKRRSSNNVAILDLSRSSSSSLSKQQSKNSVEIVGPLHRKNIRSEQRRSSDIGCSKTTVDNTSAGPRVKHVSQSDDLRFINAGAVLIRDTNLPGKVERSLSNASSTDSVRIVTPTVSSNKGKASTGGTLKELESFLATLKAKKIASQSKI